MASSQDMENWLVGLDIDREVAKKYVTTFARDEFGFTKPAHLKNVNDQILRDAGVGVARHRVDILAAQDRGVDPNANRAPTVALNGFPPLPIRSLGISSPSIPKNKHKEAFITATRNFGILSDNKLPNRMDPSVLWAYHSKTNLEWGNEADIQRFANMLLVDLISAYGLKRVEMRAEHALNGLRPDLWVLYEKFNPVGAFEIKAMSDKDAEVLNNAYVAGQVLDYLLLLRVFRGLGGPLFAVLSTYSSWRVFWINSVEVEFDSVPEDTILNPPVAISLSSSSSASSSSASSSSATSSSATSSSASSSSATSSSLLPITQRIKEIYNTLGIPGFMVPSGDSSKKVPASPVKRKIYASAIYQNDGSANSIDVQAALVSALRKMIYSFEHGPRIPFNLNATSFVVFTPDSWYWSDVMTDLKLKPSSFPNANTQSLIMIADLGTGAQGRVWLATSTGGSICVVKFPIAQKGESTGDAVLMLQQEADCWRKIWNLPARCQQLNKSLALVMPWVRTFPYLDISLDKKKLATEAVTMMALKKTWHKDLKLAHFGVYQTGKGMQAVVLDFGHIAQCDVQKALQAMLISVDSIFVNNVIT